MIRVKQIKKRLAEIDNEIRQNESLITEIRRSQVVPNDPTNNSRLALNQIHRHRSSIEKLENEKVILKDEIFKL